MEYTRLYSDSAGDSHFSDHSVDLKETDYAPPALPFAVAHPVETERIVFTTIRSGWVGEWHCTPCRQYYLQLSGTLEVETSDGEVRRFGPGSIVLVEDTVGRGHMSRVVGESDVQAAFIHLRENEA